MNDRDGDERDKGEEEGKGEKRHTARCRQRRQDARRPSLRHGDERMHGGEGSGRDEIVLYKKALGNL